MLLLTPPVALPPVPPAALLVLLLVPPVALPPAPPVALLLLVPPVAVGLTPETYAEEFERAPDRELLLALLLFVFLFSLLLVFSLLLLFDEELPLSPLPGPSLGLQGLLTFPTPWQLVLPPSPPGVAKAGDAINVVASASANNFILMKGDWKNQTDTLAQACCKFAL